MRSLAFALTALSVCLSLSGCGSDDNPRNDDSDDGSDPGDGKYRPAADGTHTTETEACATLQKAQETKVQGLKCPLTTRTCPALLRATFSTACMEYDMGSVQGCVEYYQQPGSCDGLEDAIKACVVTAYPGTEPAGCATAEP